MLQLLLQRHVLPLLWLVCVLARAPPAPRCALPPAIQHGMFPTACSNAKAGTNCTGTCSSGFSSEPAPSTTCNPNGSWSAPSAACERVCRGPPLVQVPGNTWPESCNRVRVGRWCTGQCGPGMQGAPRVYCSARGKWTAYSITRGSCQPVPPPVTCSSKPLPVGNGTFPDSCIDAAVGSSCRADCLPGFNYTGSPVATCLPGGTWSVPIAPVACEQVPLAVPGGGGGGVPGTGDEGSGAALPTDLVVASTPCQAGLALGSNASVTFSMTSSVNPEFIKGVALQLTFPTALWPTVALACHTAAGTALPCDIGPFSQDDLSRSLLSVGVMLGDMQAISSAACTLRYTTPATAAAHAALASNIDSNIIMGAVTFDELLPNVVEDGQNNAASTCAV